MSLYQMGLDAGLSQAGLSQAEVGLILAPNTDEVLEEMLSLDADVKTASREIFAAVGNKGLDDPLANFFVKGAWHDFVAKWDGFFAGNKSFARRFISTSGIYNKTQDFRREFLGLRKNAEGLGVKFVSSPVEAKESVSELAGLFRGLKLILLIAAGVIVAIILYRVMS